MEESRKAHTAEHVLFQALSRTYDDLKMHKISLGKERKRFFLEYDGDITWDGILVAEKLANAIVSENRHVRRIVASREEVEKMFPHVRAKWERIRDERICVVEVEGFDVSACSGEHVESTGQIGFIFVTRLARKGKVHEIEFEVDQKAKLEALNHGFHAQRLSELAGTSLDKTYETFANMKEKNALLEKRLDEASARIVECVPSRLMGHVELYEGLFSGLSRKRLADRAGDLIKHGRNIVLFANEEEGKTFFILARSPDIDFDASSLLGGVLSRHGGKGGGREEFAQGLARKEAYEELLTEIKKATERFK